MAELNLYAPDTPSSWSTTNGSDTSDDEQELSTLSSNLSITSSRQSISSPRPPLPKPLSACLVDPFYTLPIELDATNSQLLYFYGQDNYWTSAYALSPKIRPSLKGSWEYQAGACLSHFHILMARSALHQLRMNSQWGSESSRRELEYAALKHQTKAISILRENVALGEEADLKVILTSVISLATFEQRYGDRERAVLHFKTGRDIIRQIGMQDDGLNDRLVEEQALWFEGIYRDPEASWLWGKEDATSRLTWLKSLLKEVDRMWRDRQLMPLREKSQGYVPAGSRLREFLSRETSGRSVSVYGDIDEFIAQQRCVLIIVTVMCGMYDELSEGGGLRTLSKAMALNDATRTYSSFVENQLIQHDLDQRHAQADLLWMMCQNYRDVGSHLVQTASSSLGRDAMRRLDLKDCHWRASGIANVMKYLPEGRQLSLRNMLLDFIDGKPYTGKMRVNEFEFSYAGL